MSREIGTEKGVQYSSAHTHTHTAIIEKKRTLAHLQMCLRGVDRKKRSEKAQPVHVIDGDERQKAQGMIAFYLRRADN